MSVEFIPQVVILFLSGLTLSLTAQCTFGDKRLVDQSLPNYVIQHSQCCESFLLYTCRVWY